MKMVLSHSGKFFVPIWAKRTKGKIVTYWDKRFTITKIPIEEAHFTYPQDGDFHYTFYTNKRNKAGIRQFCDRLQYFKNGRKTKEVIRTGENEIFDMQPRFKTGWEKLPLDGFKSEVVNLILPIFGFGLPFEKSMARRIFTDGKPKYSTSELIDISEPDKGSFNVGFTIRGKQANFQSDRYRFLVEDIESDPIISLTLSHILH